MGDFLKDLFGTTKEAGAELNEKLAGYSEDELNVILAAEAYMLKTAEEMSAAGESVRDLDTISDEEYMGLVQESLKELAEAEGVDLEGGEVPEELDKEAVDYATAMAKVAGAAEFGAQMAIYEFQKSAAKGGGFKATLLEWLTGKGGKWTRKASLKDIYRKMGKGRLALLAGGTAAAGGAGLAAALNKGKKRD